MVNYFFLSLFSLSLSRARAVWIRILHLTQVCLKVVKNHKDFLDQCLDEVKLLNYLKTHGDPDEFNFVEMLGIFFFSF